MRPPARPRGATLMELLVAMTLLAIVGSATAAAVRMQTGVRARVAGRVSAATQHREAIAPLLADLAMVSPAAGDIPPGGARDSTLDLRATIAQGHVCSAGIGDGETLWIALRTAATSRSIVAGDSVWLYDGADEWHVAPVLSVGWGAPPDGDCVQSADATVLAIGIDSIVRGGIPPGAPARFTRPGRYSFYRASDGATYLGLREWSHSANGLATVQPIAGPFIRGATRFAYFDTAGAELTAAPVPSAHIASIEIRLSSTPPPGAADDLPISSSITVALRNRR